MKPVVSIVTVIVVLGGVVAIVYGVAFRAPRVTQPIQFNHVVHLEDAGLECTECHKDATSHTFAGIPGRVVCFDCHDPNDEENTDPEKAKLYAFSEGDQDIPWKRVTISRADVFFSHRRHVVSGKLACLECHTNQNSLTAPPSTAHLVIRMTDCIDCHDRRGASHDCLVCHR